MIEMKAPKRSRRRADLARMKKKASRIYPKSRNPEILANHLQCCSCYGCGNPRRHTGELTLAERRQDEAFRIWDV